MWTQLVARWHGGQQEERKEDSLNEPDVSEEDVSSFIWLSTEEKQAVLAKSQAISGASKKAYLKDVRFRGYFLQFRYNVPGILEVIQRLHAEPSKVLLEQEWKTPSTKADLELSEDEEHEEREKEPFEGIIVLDEDTHQQIEILAKEAVERYRFRVAQGEAFHPCKDVEASLAEEQEVNRLLLLAGYENPEESSKCVRAGLIRGHFGFKFTGEASQLDIVVREGKCSDFNYDEECSGTLQATVRKLLKQPDCAGLDYCDNSLNAPVKCGTCGQGQYVTFCCISDKPRWNNGKFHNHCEVCPGLGVCMCDYREAHCYRCSGHFFRGFCISFPCPCSKLFRMISKAKKGDRAALAALFFDKERKFDEDNEAEEEEDDDDDEDWETEKDWETDNNEDEDIPCLKKVKMGV